MTCKWNGSNQPRIITDRHEDLCTDERCRGCRPCPEPHCRVCAHSHATGTCAECMAETREALHDIARMCGALPEEVEHRGVEGEAMMLLGPVADPEAWGHVTASVSAGRLPKGYVEDGGGEQHPMTTFLSWQMVWRDALEHDDAPDSELTTAVDYLDQTMTYMGGYEYVPFEDFARDLRRCRAHLEAVLHDGEQVDRGAPCMTCGADLQRTWGEGDAADGWKCPRCKRTSSDAQYRFAVWQDYLEKADWLSAKGCVAALAQHEPPVVVVEGTIRSWASKGHLTSKRDGMQTVYSRESLFSHAVAQVVA